MIPKMTNMLMVLYDADILEEELIQKWYKHPSKKLDENLSKAVRDSAKKFIDWLKTAEEGDE